MLNNHILTYSQWLICTVQLFPPNNNDAKLLYILCTIDMQVTLFQKIGILRIRVIDVGISGYSVTLINGTNHRIINDRMEKHGSLFVFISK